MVKSPGQQVAAATALITGTAIGVLTAGLGLALLASPWELHFTARHIATVAMVVVGLSAVVIGAVMVIDLVRGSPCLDSPDRTSRARWRPATTAEGPGRFSAPRPSRLRSSAAPLGRSTNRSTPSGT